MRTLYALLVIVALTTGCKRNRSHAGASSSSETNGKSCADKGVEYYKEIGSYPTLSNGGSAMELILQKCTRSPVAFDGL